MFIIDENRYPQSWKRSTEYDIIGGAGLYALIGARMVVGARKSKKVCAIIDKGSDFPENVEKELTSWNTGILFRTDTTRLTSRGANTYDENGIRHFEYLTPKKRIVAEDILSDSFLLLSASFHLICSVDRCGSLIKDIGTSNPQTLFVYEPLPDDCVQPNFETLLQLLPKVDVFTPNLNEALSFLGIEELPDTEEQIALVASKFYKYLTKPSSGVVLRCGPLGCYVMAKNVSQLFPAYHQNQDNVKDVTGGGNLFCGGFAAALALTKDWNVSAIYGNLISGCIIEKLGMPELSQGSLNSETWNGKSLGDRLTRYRAQNPHLDFAHKIIGA